MARLYAEDLSGPVATSSDILAVSAEPDTAHNTRVIQVVYKFDVKYTADRRVEHRIPVLAYTLEVTWQVLWLQLCQHIANLWDVRV